MSNNPRDTQFAGFAKVVIDEIVMIDGTWIDTNHDGWREEWELALTRRAYDLVHHVFIDIGTYVSPEAAVVDIPDLSDLPKDKE